MRDPGWPVTKALIAANVAVFALQGVRGRAMLLRYALWPIAPVHGPHLAGRFEWWQLLTSAFLHGSVMHLLVNMLALYMFGRDLERVLGSGRFLRLYVASVLTAAIVQLTVVSFAPADAGYPTIGASGGVFGILLAFAMLFPRRTVILLFPPIPMPAWLFVALYGLFELANGVVGSQAGVAHFAHLGGMLGGYLVLRRWRRRASATAWLP